MLLGPLLNSIPFESMTIFKPFLVSMITPPELGKSLNVIVANSVLMILTSGIAGDFGASPTPQKQPVQIG